jgi:beta-glucanase (GH16 family)
MRKGLARRRPAARHARGAGESAHGTRTGRHGGGSAAGIVAPDGSDGRDAPGGTRQGRVWRPPAAWPARATGWSPAAGLFSRGIRALAGRLATVIVLVALSVVAVPIVWTELTSAAVPSAPAGWTTQFSESFAGAAGSGLDSSWTYDTGDQYHGTGCQAQWATGEIDTDTNLTANVSQDGAGHLNITPVDVNGAWTSGRIETVPQFTPPAGGEMEVSASIKQPDPSGGLGYWAAFWMLGAGYRVSGAGTSGTMNCLTWPSMGEVNVMEDVNARSDVSGTLHCGTTPGGPCNEGFGLTSGLQSCSGCQTGYNTYSVIIDRTRPSDESITWYLNGSAFHTVTESQVGAAAWQAAVDHGFFLILDVAIGGNYPNGACGCTTPSGQTASGSPMSVGSVTVRTFSGTGSATPPSPSSAPSPPSPSSAPSPPSPSSAPSPPSPSSAPSPLSPSPAPSPLSPSSTAWPPPSASPSVGGGKICTVTAMADISADCAIASSGPVSVSSASGDTSPPGTDGNQIAGLASGEWLEYPRINFGSGSMSLAARVASGACVGVSGLVEVVLDKPANPPVGGLVVVCTGGWNSWRTVQASMVKVTGIHNVFLRFYSVAAGERSFVGLHYFRFPVRS